VPHGSLFYPSHRGSAGGNGSQGQQLSPGGAGGGLLLWHVGNALAMDGFVTCAGGNGTGLNSGGGSGGSVLIYTQNLTGRGHFSVLGGVGTGLGYDGAGGRIAVHADERYLFFGELYDGGGNKIHVVNRMHPKSDKSHLLPFLTGYAGGFSPLYLEYWLPENLEGSGSGTIIYRFDMNFAYKGWFSSNPTLYPIWQLWGTTDGYYYVATGDGTAGNNKVSKLGPYPARTLSGPSSRTMCAPWR
jgi:hypothetical protein